MPAISSYICTSTSTYPYFHQSTNSYYTLSIYYFINLFFIQLSIHPSNNPLSHFLFLHPYIHQFILPFIKQLSTYNFILGIVCSYAFALPVATAPNAIVFGHSTMKTSDMMKVINCTIWKWTITFVSSVVKGKLTLNRRTENVIYRVAYHL